MRRIWLLLILLQLSLWGNNPSICVESDEYTKIDKTWTITLSGKDFHQTNSSYGLFFWHEACLFEGIVNPGYNWTVLNLTVVELSTPIRFNFWLSYKAAGNAIDIKPVRYLQNSTGPYPYKLKEGAHFDYSFMWDWRDLSSITRFDELPRILLLIEQDYWDPDNQWDDFQGTIILDIHLVISTWEISLEEYNQYLFVQLTETPGHTGFEGSFALVVIICLVWCRKNPRG